MTYNAARSDECMQAVNATTHAALALALLPMAADTTCACNVCMVLHCACQALFTVLHCWLLVSNCDAALLLVNSMISHSRIIIGSINQSMFDCRNILEAQDNEMMAPFCIGQPNYIDPRRPGQRMCPST